MTQPKLSPRDIWRILIFGLAQDFESISYMEYSHAKNKLDFHRNSHSCNGCFDWCIGFLNCTGASIQRQYESIIIMKMGTGQFTPFRWSNENLFDMSRTFKMSDGKKQKATKLPHSVLPRLRFCAIVPQILRDIWRILIFGLVQDFESISYMEYSHAKNSLVSHRNSRSCNGCFDWCIGFLNCTGTSVQQKYVWIIIMKMGTG